MSAEDLLASWNDGPTRDAIVTYVGRVTGDGPDSIPESGRIATLDNDGTLWCEKPLPIQLGFILMQLAGMAHADPTLQDKQPHEFFLGDYSPLKRDYLPPDYRKDSEKHEIVKTVHVEAECSRDQQVAETRWLTGIHRQYGMPNAIVGHAWFHAGNTAEILEQHKDFPLVRGIRSKPADEAMMKDAKWLAGLKLIAYWWWMLGRDDFIYVVIDTGIAFAAVAAMHLWRFNGWILAGVAVSVAAAAVQASGFAPHPGFNHNDLYHVIQLAAMFLLYRGARTLTDRA